MCSCLMCDLELYPMGFWSYTENSLYTYFLIILQHLLYIIDLDLMALTSSLIAAAMIQQKSPCALKGIKHSLSFINTKKCHCV